MEHINTSKWFVLTRPIMLSEMIPELTGYAKLAKNIEKPEVSLLQEFSPEDLGREEIELIKRGQVEELSILDRTELDSGDLDKLKNNINQVIVVLRFFFVLFA